MPANPIRTQRLPGEPPGRHTPVLPTVVFASFKGGVWKTSLAVATAERLAWAGLRVLLVTSDRQEDARSRLGILPSEAMIARREYGSGSVTVLAARQNQAIELLYTKGPTRLGIGTYDIAVVDTPPEEYGGSLPGVCLVAITDGTDAARNMLTMLKGTPDNTDIILVRVQQITVKEWAQEVAVMQRLAQRSMGYLDEPLPRVDAVKAACDRGRSVWSLPRRKTVLEFLSGIDTLAQTAWQRLGQHQPWPPMPPPGSTPLYVPGWSVDVE